MFLEKTIAVMYMLIVMKIIVAVLRYKYPSATFLATKASKYARIILLRF